LPSISSHETKRYDNPLTVIFEKNNNIELIDEIMEYYKKEADSWKTSTIWF
jgi:hypothetical protein